MGLEKINTIRKAKGMSIDDLCVRSGVAKGTLSKIAAGITKRPRIQTVQAIANALDVSVDVFDDHPTKRKASAEEMSLIEQYRLLNPHSQRLIQLIINHELARSEAER